MKFLYEIQLNDTRLTAEDWQGLVEVYSRHIGGMRPLAIHVCFEVSVVRYFLTSTKDLSTLTGAHPKFILQPSKPGDVEKVMIPKVSKGIGYAHIPEGGTFTDLKARSETQDNRTLRVATLEVQKIINNFASKLILIFTDPTSQVLVSQRQLALIPYQLLVIDFEKETNYVKKTAPLYLSLEKTAHALNSENLNALMSVDGFPYFPKPYYLNLTSYDFSKHSLIIGASGSGKSKLIELMIDRLQNTALANDYRVIVIDPHASLEAELSKVPNSKIFNLGKEAAQLFPDGNADVSGATELTTLLFSSLLKPNFTPRLERVVRFSAYVLLTAQAMSLQNLRNFVSDTDYRTEIINHVKEFVPDNVIKFFGSDFTEMKTQYNSEAIMPIIALVDEMQMQPALVGETDITMVDTVENNFLTVFSLNKVSMGEKVVKTAAGLLIQQIFLLAQARAFKQRIILIIDEVSVVQNPALAAILAEARKFGLSVILTQQYFAQVDEQLQAAIVSNVLNYYVFKVSEEDAKLVAGNLNFDIPMEIALREKTKGIDEVDLKVKYMTELNPRECLVRVVAGGQVMPVIKARTVDAPTRAVSSSDITVPVETKLPPKFERQKITLPDLPKPEEIKPEKPPELPKIENIVNVQDLPTLSQIISDISSSIGRSTQEEAKKNTTIPELKPYIQEDLAVKDTNTEGEQS
jgi:Helicase HerA, central domain/Type IV secretion-system coupling protein DNA-binding domain